MYLSETGNLEVGNQQDGHEIVALAPLMCLMRTNNQLKDGMLDAKGLDIISRRRLRTIRSDNHVLGDTKLGGESGGSILHDGVVVLGSLGAALGLGNHDVSVGDVIIRDVAAFIFYYRLRVFSDNCFVITKNDFSCI